MSIVTDKKLIELVQDGEHKIIFTISKKAKAEIFIVGDTHLIKVALSELLQDNMEIIDLFSDALNLAEQAIRRKSEQN